MVQISDLSCVICNTTYINGYYTMYSEHIFTQLGSNDLSSVNARAGWTGAMCSCLCGWVIGSCSLDNIHLTSSMYLSESKNVFVWSDQFISSNLKMHFCLAECLDPQCSGHWTPTAFPRRFSIQEVIILYFFCIVYFQFCILYFVFDPQSSRQWTVSIGHPPKLSQEVFNTRGSSENLNAVTL